METIESRQLASELQELYLENKEWLSDVFFIEDEIRFFQKLFDKVITLAIREDRVQELHPVNKSLAELMKTGQFIKSQVIKNQHLLESLIKNPEKGIELNLIEENIGIAKDIKKLFTEERTVRKALYVLAEKVFEEEDKTHLLCK